MPKAKLDEREARYIQTCIGPQLGKSEYASVSIDGAAFKMNYCILNNGDPNSFIDVVVLVTAGGAGWPLIAPLGYELANLGRQVIMVSQLGYGNSDNPPPITGSGNDFRNEAKVLNLWADKILPSRKKHWIFHSFAGSIGATLAFLNPANVASLTLLNPIGFEKRNMLAVVAKFALNGWQHGREYKNDPIWLELQKYLPRQRGMYAPSRIGQRISELRRLCKDNSLAYFEKLDPKLPYLLIAGDKDFVFSFRKSAIYARISQGGAGVFRLLYGCFHNTTMLGCYKTAIAIEEFIRRMKN